MNNAPGDDVVFHPDYRIITDIDYNHLEDPECGSIVTDLQRAFRDRTNTTIERPQIIQGGMGVGVSGWKLARAAAMSGKNGDTVGTVSGTGMEWVVAYYLKLGGQDALDIQDALKDFPDQEMVGRVLKRYSPESKTGVQVFKETHPRPLKELTVCATYAAIKLARKGHNNLISMNLLDKVGMPHPYSLLGAMLAGVDIITMGAGLPHQIPEMINAFLEGRKATFRNPVTGGGFIDISLDSKEFFEKIILPTKRPKFLPIEGSPLAIWALMKKIPKNIREDSVDGFVVEGKMAGGHNAPERAERPGKSNSFSYDEIAAFGRPFWIADGAISIKKAQELGGAGGQRGSGYALSEESGMLKIHRDAVKSESRKSTLKVKTDNAASPTGYPFKVAQIVGTVSDPEIYKNAKRDCSRGLLVEWYTKEDGTIGRRCRAEPIDDYIDKGGDIKDTVGAQCLCRRLNATIGVGEGPAIITIGTHLEFLDKLPEDYSAAEYTELLRNEEVY